MLSNGNPPQFAPDVRPHINLNQHNLDPTLTFVAVETLKLNVKILSNYNIYGSKNVIGKIPCDINKNSQAFKNVFKKFRSEQKEDEAEYYFDPISDGDLPYGLLKGLRFENKKTK